LAGDVFGPEGNILGLKGYFREHLHGFGASLGQERDFNNELGRLFASLSRCRKGIYSVSKSTHPKAKNALARGGGSFLADGWPCPCGSFAGTCPFTGFEGDVIDIGDIGDFVIA
jgi:hypothetical protein